MKFDNLFRIITYGLFGLIAGLLYFFFHSHYLLMALVAVVAAVPLSVLMNALLRRYVTAEVTAASSEDLYGRQYGEGFFYIKLKNTSWFMSLDCKMTLHISNDFFGTEGTHVVSVPVRMHGDYELTFPVRAMLPGIVTLQVERLAMKDLLGLCTVFKKIGASASVTVLPRQGSSFQYDKSVIEAGMLESEESTKRGNDFSDVQEIREYIPGDKLMSIHWKLSAKRDILMVKDRVSMSDHQLVIVPELVKDHAALEPILAATYQSIQTFLEDHTTVRLFYWSMGSYDYVETRIDYLSELNDTFARMYFEKTYEAPDEAASHMASVHPEIKAYMHITVSGGEVMCYVRENA